MHLPQQLKSDLRDADTRARRGIRAAAADLQGLGHRSPTWLLVQGRSAAARLILASRGILTVRLLMRQPSPISPSRSPPSRCSPTPSPESMCMVKSLEAGTGVDASRRGVAPTAFARFLAPAEQDVVAAPRPALGRERRRWNDGAPLGLAQRARLAVLASWTQKKGPSVLRGVCKLLASALRAHTTLAQGQHACGALGITVNGAGSGRRSAPAPVQNSHSAAAATL